MIHPLSDVQSEHIGEGTTIWQFSVVLKNARIGANCNLNCHTFIENDVVIGNHVTIKTGVYLWDGIVVEDNVFIGPNATFTNDKFPRSKQYPQEFQQTILRKGCSIGANSTLLGGIEVGSYAIIAAGSVVTKNVPAHALMIGNPARIKGWVDQTGRKLELQADGTFRNDSGAVFQVENDQLIQKS